MSEERLNVQANGVSIIMLMWALVWEHCMSRRVHQGGARC